MNSNNIEKQTKLINILDSAKGNTLDIYYVIFEEYINTDSNPSELLRLILEFPNRIGTDDGISEKISIQLENEITQKYERYLAQTVELLVKNDEPVEVFYQNLWCAIFSSPTSPNSIEECAVILKILNEDIPTLPYFQAIGVVSMEDDEFTQRIKSLVPRIREAVHMLNRHFPQKTAECSQLIRISEGLSLEDASTYWGVLFGIVQNGAYEAGRQSVSFGVDTSDSENEDEES